MAKARPPLILGFEEWVQLPALGLVAIKAKVDTGARTSALHAFAIAILGPDSAPVVRFGVHPIPGRDDIEIFCSAPLVDRREVTSSNGERELRPVIRSTLVVGLHSAEIEVTLTNRESMTYRMLLGRQAIPPGALIDASASFHLPRLSHKLYSLARR
jgi:ribosomal protein S6--L-glutamate ligase